MAEGDDRRVEPRTMAVGGLSLHATPEGIAALQAKAEKIERLRRPKPNTSFSAVLQAGKAAAAEEPPVVVDDRPKKGPRPGLTHPVHRQLYGRADSDPVIIKG